MFSDAADAKASPLRLVYNGLRSIVPKVVSMICKLLFAAVVAGSLSGCSHPNGPVSAASTIVGADQANPSPLVKIQAFGYRPDRARTDLVAVSIPQIPHASHFVVRGKLTEAGLQSRIKAARLKVDSNGRVSTESLAKSPVFELSIPTSELTPGRHAVYVEMLQAGGKMLPFEKPIIFEVDSVPERIPSGVRGAVPLAGAIDICCRLSEPGSVRASDLQLKLGDSLLVEGWAYDPTARSTGRLLLLVVDGTRAFQADYGISRPDVATFFRNQAYRDAGYTAVVPASAFSVGQHTLNLVLLSKDGKRYYTLAKPTATFSVR
jgi:hypothetical protein